MAWSNEEDVNRDVLETLDNAMRYAYSSCGIEFQREHVDKLAGLYERLKSLRYYFIGLSDEPLRERSIPLADACIWRKKLLRDVGISQASRAAQGMEQAG